LAMGFLTAAFFAGAFFAADFFAGAFLVVMCERGTSRSGSGY
jgi:hypothetical protein